MIPSMVEKLSYSVAVTILVMQHQMPGRTSFCLHRFPAGSSFCDRLCYDTAARGLSRRKAI
jgi:hypothetical protein